MSSMPDGIGAVERVAEYLKDADVDVCSLRDCETSTDGKRVRATIDVEARVDVLVETGEDSAAKQDTTTGDADAGEDSPAEAEGDDDPPETRCGDDGDTAHECPHCDYATDTERGLAIHVGRVHDEGDDEDSSGDENSETSAGGDGVTADGIDWLDRPPEEIVADSPASRSLDEVVDAVAENDNRIDIGQRLGLSALSQTRRLLQELGLSTDCDGVDGEDEIDERLAQLRDYADSEVTA